jgi:hypothetical protein
MLQRCIAARVIERSRSVASAGRAFRGCLAGGHGLTSMQPFLIEQIPCIEGEEAVIETITPIALGVLGWFVAKFLAEPFRKFFDIKGEVARQLLTFANVRAKWKEDRHSLQAVLADEEHGLPPEEEARLVLACATFRDLAARVKGFEQSEWLATRVLAILGYQLSEISKGLVGMSNNLPTYGHGRANASTKLKNELKLDV